MRKWTLLGRANREYLRWPGTRDRSTARGLEASAGHGRLFLLVGEPVAARRGQCTSWAPMPASAGVEVLLGRCEERDGAPSFWPWVQIVRAYVGHWTSESLAGRDGPGAAVIAQVIGGGADVFPSCPSRQHSVQRQRVSVLR